MAKIVFSNVSVTYDDVDILRPLDLTLDEQRIGIIGANGSGKSTLTRLINGLGDPTTGTVTVDGLDVSRQGKEVRKNVGFVFSDADNQIIMPSVVDDVAFSLRRLGIPKADRKARALQALEHFGLQDLAETSPHVLSGGQKQLLALASVLVMEPQTIVADEPTTLLDLRNRTELKRHFAQLSQQLIVVTHDLDFVRDFDRVICIDKGTVVADGTPEQTISHYVRLMEGI